MSYRRQTLSTVRHRRRGKQKNNFFFVKSLLISYMFEIIIERTG